MKVLLDIPKEMLDEMYEDNQGYFSIDIMLEITHNHKSVTENRKYGIKEAWSNDGGYRNIRFVTMDD